MKLSLNNRKTYLQLLMGYAAICVASIALQNFIFLVLAAWIYFQYKAKKKINWRFDIFGIFFIIFVATFFISSILGINPGISFQTVYKYATLLILFPIAAMAWTSLEVEQLLLSFIFGATLCSVYGISKHFLGFENRINSFCGDYMVMGGLLMSAIILLIHFLMKSPKKPIYWICFIILSLGLLLTQTRGAWLGCFVGLFIITFILNKKILLAGIISLALLYLCLPTSLKNRAKSIWDFNHFKKTASYYSIRNRIYMWESGWTISQLYPVFGIGQGNLMYIYPKYKNPLATEATEPHLHDNFMQILVQNGWVGFTFYLLFLLTYFYSSIRWAPADILGKKLNFFITCFMLASLVWGITEYTFSQQFMYTQYFLLGLQVGLWRKADPTLTSTLLNT